MQRGCSSAIAILAAAILASGASCSLFSPGKVNLKVSVSPPLATARSVAEKSIPAVVSNPGTQTSFTPSKVGITIREVILAEKMEYQDSAGGLTAGSAPQAALLSAPMDITLEPGSSSLPLDTVADLPAFSPSSYAGILLTYGEGDESCNVRVSGSFSLEGVTYTCTDLSVPFSTSGIGLNMPAAVDVGSGETPVVRIIFDLDGAAQATKTTAPCGTGWVALPDNPDVHVSVNNLIFVPYVGDAEPTVRKYAIDLTDADYNPDQWYLKLVTYFDGSTLAGAGYQMVSKLGATAAPGFCNSGGGFNPGILYFPKLGKVSDGIWDIDHVTYPRGPGASIRFPAFSLAGGSGTLEYVNPQTGAASSLGYSASEIAQ